MVTKFVITTSSLGIIIKAKNRVKAKSFPRNCKRANANAANMVTMSIIAVVTTVNTSVFSKYCARGTAVKASR